MIGPGFASAVGARTVKWIVLVVMALVVVAGIVGYEIAVWRECIPDHPWWYCLRILEK